MHFLRSIICAWIKPENLNDFLIKIGNLSDDDNQEVDRDVSKEDDLVETVADKFSKAICQ